MSIEILQSNLCKTLLFLEPYWSLLGSHMVTFITDSLYQTFIPENIREDIHDAGYDQALNMLFDNCCNKDVEGYSKFGQLLNKINEIHCDNRKTDYFRIKDFREFLYRNNCKKLSMVRLNEFMSDKKCHEVSLMSVMVAELDSMSSSSIIVDIGDGKGYLSSFLSLEYNLKILGIDSSSIKTEGAAKRNKKLTKLWRGTRKKYKDENNEIKTSTSPSKEPMYKQTTEFISDTTQLSDIIKREFVDQFDDIGLVGLHTCGDLAPVCLRQYVKDSNLKYIVNVGCCYHLLTESTGDATAICGFPMSKYLKDKSFRFGRNARMISLKPKWKIGSERSLPSDSLLYRAILQKILLDKVGDHDVINNVQVGRIASKCSSFVQYVRLVITKHHLDVQVSDQEIVEYFEKYNESSVRNELWIYFMMFCCLSSLLEDIILLDRLLYLKEQGLERSYIVEVFDPIISPRSHAIVSYR